MAEVVNNKTAAENTQKWKSAEMVAKKVKVPVALVHRNLFVNKAKFLREN